MSITVLEYTTSEIADDRDLCNELSKEHNIFENAYMAVGLYDMSELVWESPMIVVPMRDIKRGTSPLAEAFKEANLFAGLTDDVRDAAVLMQVQFRHAGEGRGYLALITGWPPESNGPSVVEIATIPA